jgi:hypothetical protein
MGTSHGRRGFLNLSHQRSLLWRLSGLEKVNDLARYPFAFGTPLNKLLVFKLLLKKWNGTTTVGWVALLKTVLRYLVLAGLFGWGAGSVGYKLGLKAAAGRPAIA